MSPGALFLALTALCALALLPGVSAECLSVTYPSPTLFSSQSWAAGSDIVIPAGQVYMFDLDNSPIYGGIVVEGTLLFDDSKDVFMHTHHVTVMDGGKFLIGTCDCPHQNQATIELHDAGNQNYNPHGVGTKVVGALPGGTIEFYGQVNGPSWTRLGAQADAGSSSITLEESVNWQVGDEIIVVGTSYVNNWYNAPENWNNHQTEERTITNVNGNVVTLDSPLSYTHWAESRHGVPIYAEVALLSKRIKIQGDASSDSSKFGAHTMFLSGSTIQLSGVEIFRGGQGGHLGRYPVHFHLFGDASGMNVQDTSVHHSYQRCFTLHGVHGLTLARNVGYWSMGHCYFLEDGIEEENTLAYNLATATFKHDLIPSDSSPTGFWITNPNNNFIGNSASYSPSHCMWIAPPRLPLGPSFTFDILPRNTPLARFEHNTMHSCGGDGLHADNGPNQAGDPGGSDSNEVTRAQSVDADGNTKTFNICTGYCPRGSGARLEVITSGSKDAVYRDTTVWMVAGRAIWVRGGPHFFDGLKFAGNKNGIILAVQSFSKVHNGIFVGEIIPDQFGAYPIRGYSFYDGPNELKNARFYDFEKTATHPTASAISMLREDAFSISNLNHASECWFAEGTHPFHLPDLLHAGDIGAVFLDLDGTVTGRPPISTTQIATVVNNHPFHLTPGCDNLDSTHQAYVCPNHFVSFSISQSGVSAKPSASDVQSMDGLWRVTRRDKLDSPWYMCPGQCNNPPEDSWMNHNADSGFGSIMLYREYYFHWMGPATGRLTLNIGKQAHTVNEDGSAPYNELLIGVCYPKTSRVQDVTYYWKNGVQPAASMAELLSNPYTGSWSTRGNGLYFHDISTGYVWVRAIMNSEITNQLDFENYNTLVVQITMDSYAGVADCPMSGIPEIGDTVRVLPNKGTPAQVPPKGPEVVSEAFDFFGATCSGSPPPPTPPPAPTPPQPTPEPVTPDPVSMYYGLQPVTGSSASGHVTFTLTGNLLEWEIIHDLGPAATNSHIHNGGNIVVNIGSELSSPVTGSVALTDSQLTMLCDGSSYLNIHSTSHAGGELEAYITVDCPPSEPPLPVDCEVSEWTISDCTGECGQTGTRTRARVIVTSPVGSGAPCPALEVQEACEMPACPVNCQVSDFTDWTVCSETCGGGLQTRSRTIMVNPANGGTPCPSPLEEERVCNDHECEVDCLVSEWTEFNTCSATCGEGTRTRTRSITRSPSPGGVQCPTELSQTEACVVDCDCVVSDYGEWSECTKTCGGGVRERSRSVITPAAGNGAACPRDEFLREIDNCNVEPCDQDCVQTDWTDFSACSAACDGGVQSRTRETTVPTVGNGAPCGALIDEQPCNTQMCTPDPVACTWNEWGAWGECSVKCNGGVQTSTRTQNAAQNGGAVCEGESSRTQNCNTQACPEVVNCAWGEWGQFGTCSVTCGGGVHSRTRAIAVEAANGGVPCEGGSSEQAVCNDQVCDKDCVVSAWSEWQPCNVECGSGVQTRSRTITSDAVAMGAACPPLSEEQECLMDPCVPTPPAPRNCEVTSWSGFDECSASCTQTRTRTVVRQADPAGVSCPDLSETIRCSGGLCVGDPEDDQDCVVTPWSSWTGCSCNTNTQSRSRDVEIPARNNGASCSALSETRACDCESPGKSPSPRNDDGLNSGDEASFMDQEVSPGSGFLNWMLVVAVVGGVAVLAGVGFAVYWFAIRNPDPYSDFI